MVKQKKKNKTLIIVLICIAGAAALFGIVFAIDRLAFGGMIFPYTEEEQPEEIPAECADPSSMSKPKCSQYWMVKKPIIYLYPEKETEVSITLGYPEKLTTVYPDYNDGWRVFAEPSGKLTDLSTDRELYALYWEGKDAAYHQTNEGFIVKSSDAKSFLEEKLALLGLNPREAEEFIVYWLPELESNNYNYIRFATSEEIESNMPLSVSPKPDTIIRVMMIWRGLDQPITITEQQLESPIRTGFTVVEWGGTKLAK